MIIIDEQIEKINQTISRIESIIKDLDDVEKRMEESISNGRKVLKELDAILDKENTQ